MLSTAEEMEAKQRTEEQIQARVKKLGLSAATLASPKGTDDGEAEADRGASGQENNTAEDGVEDSGSAKPVLRARKLKRKNQAESDEDSEGLLEVHTCLDPPSMLDYFEVDINMPAAPEVHAKRATGFHHIHIFQLAENALCLVCLRYAI